jgi:hypothetical protein
MKTPYQFIALFVLFQATVEADILYQNDFSGDSIPGYSRGTVNGDTAFNNSWSVTPSLESASGNQYARFDFNITAQPPYPYTTWHGGFYNLATTLTTLPTEWQLSCDIFVNSLDPIQVSFDCIGNPANPPFYNVTTRSYWVQPTDVGWQPVVIDQSTDFSVAQSFSARNNGTYLHVNLVSHDATGNPLSISQIGTYDFLLDNVLLQEVPEPSALGLCAMASVLFIGMRLYRANRSRQRGMASPAPPSRTWSSDPRA